MRVLASKMRLDRGGRGRRPSRRDPSSVGLRPHLPPQGGKGGRTPSNAASSRSSGRSSLFSVSALPAAWHSYLDSLGPLDLASSRIGSTIVVDRDGRLLRAFTLPNGRWRLPVTDAEVDPRYLAMLLAYEDGRFYAHGGVDWRAMARAAGQWIARGHVVSGGSTLTMQVARLIEPRDDRTLSAKARQMTRAWQMERRLAKSGIVDRYLMLAPFGGNLEGVRAASLAYFGKEPRKLTIGEAALLVALPQSPEARRPERFPDAARIARARVLDRVAARGIISQEEADAAKREPIPQTRKPFPMLAAHAAEEAVAADPSAHVLQLSIDARLQAKLETLARESVERLGPKLSAAIVVVDNASGEISARIGAADYLDAARDGSVDMSRAPRSPGSALKPFIYALAFEEGLAHPETVLFDRPARYGAYAPQNFDLGYQGTVTARKALQMSLNLPAIELLADVGPTSFLARLHGAGAEIALPKDTPIGLAIGLGGLGISLTDIARLYAGLARGGEAPALIERLDGAPPIIGPRRVTDPVAAYYVEDILRGAPPPSNALSGRIAYKTGTSYGFRDALAIGFDRGTTIAVWVGRPDNGPTPGLIGRAGRRADPVRRLRAARSRHRTDPPAQGRVARRHERRAAAAAAPSAQGCAQDDGRDRRAAAENRLSARRRAHRPRPEGRRARANSGAQGAGRRAAADLVRQRRADRRARRAPSVRLAPDGAGFARVSVIDANGASDSILVRLE